MVRPTRFLMSLIGMNGYPAWRLWLCCPLCIFAQTVEPTVKISGFGKPDIIATVELAEFDSLPLDRRTLIEAAIAVARDSPWPPYTARGTEPSDGGFDCSGAMYFLMRSVDICRTPVDQSPVVMGTSPVATSSSFQSRALVLSRSR